MASKISSILAAAKSAARFTELAVRHELKLGHTYLHKTYTVQNHSYYVFRETTKPSQIGEANVLVVGFCLKGVRSNLLLHWVFQRACILTTPFWAGLPGFKTKLWMVDPATKNYLGIYDWRGTQASAAYLQFLLPILQFFSVRSSVWSQHMRGSNFDQYLATHLKTTP